MALAAPPGTAASLICFRRGAHQNNTVSIWKWRTLPEFQTWADARTDLLIGQLSGHRPRSAWSDLSYEAVNKATVETIRKEKTASTGELPSAGSSLERNLQAVKHRRIPDGPRAIPMPGRC